MIASARLYERAPSLTTAWRRLLEWTAARAGVPLDVLDTRSISLDEVESRDDPGRVFMGGYPWALAARRPALLAAPVPSMVSRSRSRWATAIRRVRIRCAHASPS